jgi:anti-anti-sigma regulatory factor
MSAPGSKMLVLAGEKFACVKIVGRGDFTNSVEFTTLIRELRQMGLHYFVLDLTECTLLDSTFLGVLAGLGLQIAQGQADHCDEGLELLNANARITELLECLGVIQLFKMKHGQVNNAEQTHSVPHTAVTPTKEETTRACLEAHRTLMEVNPANAARFRDVAQFLAEDLKRIKKEGLEPKSKV